MSTLSNWNGKRYHTLNYEMTEVFGEKVLKLSLDGGFTCPNRDGTLGNKGCIFCGEVGSGEFAGSRCVSIREQAEEQKKLLKNKNKTNKYIAYFQNFTNTYGDIDYLRRLYEEALSIEGVVGLAIATRPDCLSHEVLELLSELNNRTFLWIELGLQSIHEKSSRFIRRGYPLSVYDEAIKNLRERNIRSVTHLIVGLPNESKEEILESVSYVSRTGIWGIKLHSLYISKDTDLYSYYLRNPFQLFTMEEYVDIIVDAIEILPKDMVVHRVTGDGKKDLLFEPKWSLNKLKVLTSIDKELKERGSYQGKKNT